MLSNLRTICVSLLLSRVLSERNLNKCQQVDLIPHYAKESHIYQKEGHELNTKCWRSHSDDRKNCVNMASGSSSFYRPRSAMARALYEKQSNDLYLQEFDKTEWYRVNPDRLSPELNQKFVQLHADEETQEFLTASVDKSQWVWTQIWYILAKTVLKHFWSITDINGWLGRGSMFVLSENQTRQMLTAAPRSARDGAGAMVDVGAGDGEVSRRFSRLYTAKYATEISGSMRKALSKKGYALLDIDEWWNGQQFECVCMLNLLDRCSKPKTMLKQAKGAIAPGGVLMLALVLPYKPYVEVTPDHKPEERLPIQGLGFEEQASAFIKWMEEEAGFELVSWARAPYLCEGDFSQAYYWLDDSVYVFTPRLNGELRSEHLKF